MVKLPGNPLLRAVLISSLTLTIASLASAAPRQREFPVSMLYGSRTTSTVSIRVPPGYEVKETPADRRTTVGRDDASFVRTVDVGPSVVQVRMDLVVNRTDYPPRMYAELRSFYEQIASLEPEKIVFQKKAVSPVKTGAKPAGRTSL